MSAVLGRVIFLKVRRIVDLLVVLFLLLIAYHVYQKWSSGSTDKIQINRNVSQSGQEKVLKKEFKTPSDLAKYIHLDLKGAPPKAEKFYDSFFEFLEQLQMGVKGVVIEYEDTLPLNGSLSNMIHRAGYTKSDIKLIQDSAKKHQLEIIPLIQTFGHLEWILKLDEYQSYRDDKNLPTVISPCINATYILLEDLLQQTLDMHPNSQIIHIGCDEVALTASHPECQTTYMSTYERYINHIQRVVLIVRKIRPGIRVLIWDDILRNEQSITNQNSLNPLKGLVEPVSWNYFSNFSEQYKSSSAWKIYPKFFNHMWAASAFKGGQHRFSMNTNTEHHVFNNYQWRHFMQSSTFSKDSFSAIILTGWSRFDHFMPLCDLLPTAYPSLLYSLFVLNTSQARVNDDIHDCDVLLRSIEKKSDLCAFLPGLSIWSSVSSMSTLLPRIRSHLKLIHTVAPEYNREHSFVRRHELGYFLSGLHTLRKELKNAKQLLKRRLSELYTEDVIKEWLDLYVTPAEVQINTTVAEFAPALVKRTWPRRPLS